MSDELKTMVNRFLAWKLPADFYPDCHIHFDREKAEKLGPQLWPSGTNLLNANQAEAMIQHVAEPLTADLATLRATITRLEGERDEWKQAVEELQDRYARMMAMRDTCAAERNAEYATVAALTEERNRYADLLDYTSVKCVRVMADRDRYRAALAEIAKYPPIHPIATAVGDIARAALQEPKV